MGPWCPLLIQEAREHCTAYDAQIRTVSPDHPGRPIASLDERHPTHRESYLDHYRRTLRESGLDASRVPFFSYLSPQSTAASSGLHQSGAASGPGETSGWGLPNRLRV